MKDSATVLVNTAAASNVVAAAIEDLAAFDADAVIAEFAIWIKDVVGLGIPEEATAEVMNLQFSEPVIDCWRWIWHQRAHPMLTFLSPSRSWQHESMTMTTSFFLVIIMGWQLTWPILEVWV